ncbi:MAG TPA: serine hydrolase domain-containing protein [Longimicrobium sp.]|nr:serine hydrolase domain-containing protein [Longimicrobium sp.]
MTPNRFAAALAALSLAAPLAAQAPRPDPAPLERRIGASLDSLAEAGWLSGAVLVTRGDDTLFARAYGEADRERGVANTLETPFDVASMNKMMTAVAVVQLVEQGRIRLSDTVGAYLPDYPDATVRSRVTVAHLLSHTGGLGSYWNARYAERRTSVRDVAAYLALFADEPPSFAPGERYQYSNGGFIVLGAIIEKVTGTSYYDYVARNVVAPAGMTGTGFPSLDERVGMAMGYTAPRLGSGPRRAPDFRQPAPDRVPATAMLPGRGGPAGGGASTVGDQARFIRALAQGKLVGAAMVDSLWTARATPGPEGRGQPPYGYGFVLRQTPLGRAVGHPGGSDGAGGFLQHYPERGITVSILVNVDPMVTFEALARIERELARAG